MSFIFWMAETIRPQSHIFAWENCFLFQKWCMLPSIFKSEFCPLCRTEMISCINPSWLVYKKYLSSHEQTSVHDLYFEHFLLTWPHLNATRPQWWLVNIGSGNGLLSSGNKPLPDPKVTQIYVAINSLQYVNAGSAILFFNLLSWLCTLPER